MASDSDKLLHLKVGSSDPGGDSHGELPSPSLQHLPTPTDPEISLRESGRGPDPTLDDSGKKQLLHIPVLALSECQKEVVGSDLPEPIESTLINRQIPATDYHQQLPGNYNLRELELQLRFDETEEICAISAHQSNLYLGTTAGQLLHLFLFDDAEEYILVSKLSVGTECSIAKILLLPDVELCLLLSNHIIFTYLLPELSPCNVGKLRDIQDILMLCQVKVPKVKSKLDKIIAFTPSKIGLIQFSKDAVKLLKEIPYVGSLVGLSSASGTLANYSNICLVANSAHYDVVDVQQTLRVPLSEYNPMKIKFLDRSHEVQPHIVPFLAEDKDKTPEEYLLTICSGSSSSMALFVNSEGDVTRGTLTWLEEGYPTGGLVVEWPFAVGLFWSEDARKYSLCFSSLQSLQTVYTTEASKIFSSSDTGGKGFHVRKIDHGFSVLDQECLNLLKLVSCVHRELVPSSNQYKRATIAFTSGSKLAFLDRKSHLSMELQAIQTKLHSAQERLALIECSASLKALTETSDQVWPVYIASLLLEGQLQKVKEIVQSQHNSNRKVDPRLLLLFSSDTIDLTSEYWIEYSAPRLVFEFLDSRKAEIDLDLKSWTIEEIYKNRDSYSEETNAEFRKYMYTEIQRDTASLILLIESEKELWKAQNETSDALHSYLSENSHFIALLYLYHLKQQAGNAFVKWEQLIIELGLDILAGRKKLTDQDKEYLQTGATDIAVMIFDQLHEQINEEGYFTRTLLELLQLQPEHGLALLKKRKNGKFLSCNKQILAELSKLVKLDRQFGSLKLEYTEQAFFAEFDLDSNFEIHAQELSDELVAGMNEEHFDDEFENLGIVYQTYQVETDLGNGSWPKVTWIEYLHLRANSSECRELAHMYMKLYEVLVVSKAVLNGFRRILPVTEYMEFVLKTRDTVSESETISYLLSMRDLSSAEWVAVHGSFPIPRSTVYPLEKYGKSTALKSEQVYENLKQIMGHYLRIEDECIKYSAVAHFFSSLGGPFAITEVLDIIPDDFPLWCLEKYLECKITSNMLDYSDSGIKKALARSEAKFSKTLLNHFKLLNK